MALLPSYSAPHEVSRCDTFLYYIPGIHTNTITGPIFSHHTNIYKQLSHTLVSPLSPYCPPSELAHQVGRLAKKMIKVVGGKSVNVTGGIGTYEMTRELKRGCEVVVSTPGRLIDMVHRKATNLSRVTLVVLDEADKMLEMGFGAQVGSLIEAVRPDRQTVMFSATFGRRVEKRYAHAPLLVRLLVHTSCLFSVFLCMFVCRRV